LEHGAWPTRESGTAVGRHGGTAFGMADESGVRGFWWSRILPFWLTAPRRKGNPTENRTVK